MEQRQGELTALVQAEQVRLIVEQVRRVPLPNFVIGVVIAWIGWRAGLGAIAWIWLAVMTAGQIGRTIYLSHLYRTGRASPAALLGRHAQLQAVLGALHAGMMAMVFARPSSDAQYLLTMVMVGNAAGAVIMVAGHLRGYLIWAAVFGGSLTACWLTRQSVEGVAVAVLIAMLFAMLALYVRDQGRTLAQMVTLTEELRRERDKFAQVSDELRRERDRAERASEAKTRFFASASHDLRQPLTALSYNAATVQALAASNGDAALSRVGEGIQRALAESRALLDSLLEVSELDACAVEVRRDSVDVGALLAQVAESFAPLATGRGLVLRAVKPAEAALHAHTDIALLRRILQNLTGNAIKFTDRGTVTLEARVESGTDAGMIRVQVSDTGSGIPFEAQERVFEEFFQVGNVERNRSRGLGLGLSIVRRLAALLDTRVHVKSAQGEGSTFSILLPRSDQPPASSMSSPPADIGRNAIPKLRRMLVIDDEPAIRDSLSTLLLACGWEVAAEPGAEEALQCIGRGFVPDALIVDFRLRVGASGLDALTMLRTAGCNAPAWLITGDTEPRRIAEARAAGVPVIYKPVDGLHLIATLRDALDESDQVHR